MSILETERLYLRNLEVNDLDEIYDYRNNEECSRYQRWNDCTKDDIKKYTLKTNIANLLPT
jgi:RimJ/RimL family protein N-acetyltransferase